jgi:hypothetical protein
MPQTPTRDLSQVDWSKQTRQIARELHTSPQRVSRLRAIHAPQTVTHRSKTAEPKKLVTLTFRTTEEFANRLNQVSKRTNTNRGTIIRNAVESALRWAM